MPKRVLLAIGFCGLSFAGVIGTSSVAAKSAEVGSFNCHIEGAGKGNFFRAKKHATTAFGEYNYFDKNREQQKGEIMCIPEATRILCGIPPEKNSPHRTVFYFDWKFKSLTRVVITMPESTKTPPKFTEYKVSCK